MNHISRRTVLQWGAGTLASLGLGGRFSQLARLSAQSAVPSTIVPSDYRALVCIFLAGGSDTNNWVVPIKTGIQQYSDYLAARGPVLGVPQANLLAVSSGVSDQYGLHPNMAALLPIYTQNDLAIVANVGMLVKPVTPAQVIQGTVPYPVNLFSHADQQRQWQTAQPQVSSGVGWGGRVADIMSGANPGATLPLGLSTAGNALYLNGASTASGQVPTTSFSLNGSDAGPRDWAQQQVLTFDSGMSLIQVANLTAQQGLFLTKTLNAALNGGQPLVTKFPTTSLGMQLQQVAQIMSIRSSLGMNRQIFYVSLGGFDTHTNQPVTEYHLASQLADAMAAFYNATVELGIASQVVTFTESEFGRTCRGNSTYGTDHAWGSHHLVMGGSVKTSGVYGTFPLLRLGGPNDLRSSGVWVPSTAVDQYGATLASWFGVPDASMNSVFPNLPNFPTRNLGFV